MPSRTTATAWLDLRFALRNFAKQRSFPAVAVLTLALGIGTATSVFSIVDAVLLRPLPYRDPSRLVWIVVSSTHERGLAKIFPKYADYIEFRKHARSFESLSGATWATHRASSVLTGYGPAREVLTIPATASLFETLGVHATIGRTFRGDDERLGCAVVLAHGFWASTLGADRSITTKTLQLDQNPCSVLGVMPESFSFYPSQTEAWILLRPGFEPEQDKMNLGIFGRLKPGVTRAQAEAEVQSLYRAMHHREDWRDFLPIVLDLHGEFTFLAGRNLRTTLIITFAAVLFVVLIACLNVANLFLARLSERQREFAVRAALGSGQGRLVRQILTEGLVLAFMGAALGTALAYGAVAYLRKAHPIELTAGATVDVNLTVLAFSALLALTTVLIFGLAPALRASRVDLTHWLKVAGRGSVSGGHVLARTLIAIEVALSFVLLTGAGLLLASALHMDSEPLGFQPEGLMTTSISVPSARYPDAKARSGLYDRLLERFGDKSGFALTTSVPPYTGGVDALEIQGRESETSFHDVGVDRVSPSFFNVLGVPLLRGRLFDSRDRANTPAVAIVNEALVRRYFPHFDALGRQIRSRGAKDWLTVVGVVGNVKHSELMNEMSWVETPVFYRPLMQDPVPSVQIIERNIPERDIREEIASLDPNMPVNNLVPVASRIGKVLSYPHFRATVFTFFAVGALLLSTIGLHGVLSQLVVQRVPEFGVRRALGAQNRDLLWLVARYGGVPLITGLAAGLALTFAFTGVLRNLLYGIQPTDPSALAGVSLLLVASAITTILLPARRAMRIDPMAALRQE